MIKYYLICILFHKVLANCGTSSTYGGSLKGEEIKYKEGDVVKSTCKLSDRIYLDLDRKCEKGKWIEQNDSSIPSFLYRSCLKSASEFLDIESIEVTELDEEPLTVRYGSVPDENIVNVVDWSPDGSKVAKKCFTSKSSRKQSWRITFDKSTIFSLIEFQLLLQSDKRRVELAPHADTYHSKGCKHIDSNLYGLVPYKVEETIVSNFLSGASTAEKETNLTERLVYSNFLCESKGFADGGDEDNSVFSVNKVAKTVHITFPEDNYSEEIILCGIEAFQFPILSCGQPENPLESMVKIVKVNVDVPAEDGKVTHLQTDKAIFSCNEGYVLDDIDPLYVQYGGLVCGPDATWLGHPPSCKPLHICSLSDFIANSTNVTISNVTDEFYFKQTMYAINGTELDVQCNGNVTRTKCIDQRWSNLPSCSSVIKKSGMDDKDTSNPLPQTSKTPLTIGVLFLIAVLMILGCWVVNELCGKQRKRNIFGMDSNKQNGLKSNLELRTISKVGEKLMDNKTRLNSVKEEDENCEPETKELPKQEDSLSTELRTSFEESLEVKAVEV